MVTVPLKVAVFTYWLDRDGGIEGKNPVQPGRSFDPARMGQSEELYVDILLGLLYRPTDPQRGMDLAELRKVNKIVDVLEAAKDAQADHVDLEDAYFDLVKARIEGAKYLVYQRPFLHFAEDIVGARERQEQAAAAARKETAPAG